MEEEEQNGIQIPDWENNILNELEVYNQHDESGPQQTTEIIFENIAFYEISPKIADKLKEFPNLVSFGINNCELKDIHRFPNMEKLIRLELSYNNLKLEQLQYIYKLKNLKSLVLSGWPVSNIEDLQELRYNNENLQQLDVFRTKFSENTGYREEIFQLFEKQIVFVDNLAQGQNECFIPEDNINLNQMMQYSETSSDLDDDQKRQIEEEEKAKFIKELTQSNDDLDQQQEQQEQDQWEQKQKENENTKQNDHENDENMDQNDKSIQNKHQGYQRKNVEKPWNKNKRKRKKSESEQLKQDNTNFDKQSGDEIKKQVKQDDNLEQQEHSQIIKKYLVQSQLKDMQKTLNIKQQELNQEGIENDTSKKSTPQQQRVTRSQSRSKQSTPDRKGKNIQV